jgi:hypothetical protein
VLDQLRDARDRRGDHRDARGHGFDEYVRDAVAVPVGEHAAGEGEDRGASIELDQLFLTSGAGKAHDLPETERRRVRLQSGPLGALSDDETSELVLPVQ